MALPPVAGDVRLPVLPDSDQRELCALAQAGDLEARNRLIRHTMGLVYQEARRAERGHEDANDLAHECVPGLIRAIELYEPVRGVPFINYAGHWIDQKIRMGRLKRPTVRIPQYAAAAGESVDVLSLDHTYDGDEHGAVTLGDLQAADTPADADLLDSDRQTTLNLLLSVLSERESEIVMRVNGLSGYPEEQQIDIGIRFGVSRERIRQIYHRALQKLRRAPGTRTLLSDLLT
jgi:RNA polymerase sigma factor (sigma-70 family)